MHLFLAHLPTESSGVCDNEPDAPWMAQLTKTLLLIQWGVSEDHHLKNQSQENWYITWMFDTSKPYVTFSLYGPVYRIQSKVRDVLCLSVKPFKSQTFCCQDSYLESQKQLFIQRSGVGRHLHTWVQVRQLLQGTCGSVLTEMRLLQEKLVQR